MAESSGYKFPILNSDGTSSGTVVDFADMFVKKELFFNAGLWTWGRNLSGQLGNGTSVSYSSPIQIGSLTNWKQVSVGINYSIAAIKTDGTLWAWGNGESGQLGNGKLVDYSSPIQIGSLANWKQISHGVCSAAIKTDGTLWTWGYNTYGTLGNNTTVYYSSPIQIGSLTDWKQVCVGGTLTVSAIKTDGTLWVWGRGLNGALGIDTTINYSSPIQIGTLTDWKYVSTNGPETLAIKTDGTLWGWGANGNGRLGNGTTIGYSSPIQIGSLTNWQTISVDSHVSAIKTDGTLWAWGNNASGQLGNGTTIAYSSPIQIGALTNWKQVSVFSSSSITRVTAAIKTDGTLWQWGYSQFGEIGNNIANKYYSSPIQIGSLTNWKQVSVSIYATAAIQSPDLP